MELTDEMVERFRVLPGLRVRLDKVPTRWDVPGELEDLNKEELKQQAADFVAERVRELAGLQDLLWADGRYGLLVIFQGMDGAGKDSTIKHVTAGMNPSGVRVRSFREPTWEELRRNYLWRYVNAMPEQGQIGIFNRSYYEEIGVVRVNPELLRTRSMPDRRIDGAFWAERLADINFLENQMVRNGTMVLKFFLHISKREQAKRLLERLQTPEKQWKFSPSDMAARDRWDDYQRVYEEMLSHTSTEHAPWWIMPADRKWAMRTIVAQVMSREMRKLELRYPPVDAAKREQIRRAIETLKSEG
jgi:PPK2 family polyphosphate:nucleotide phosphotransferase